MKHLIAFLLLCSTAFAESRPNVILMMTDDQGIGDFGVMGNKIIETPNIDAMAANSGSLSTFYVSPVCSPTRASLMTGRYNQRTRCIDTWIGRSMMDADEFTLAEALKASGYSTGIFGKWHLGDCYPMRPQDQGFDDVLIHRGGGLAQPADPLENEDRYTDPILFDEKGDAIKTTGYCTDVYFDAAMAFMDERKDSDDPFFIYLATNAPHGPFHDVPEDLYQHYLQKDLLSLLSNPPKAADRAFTAQDKMARIFAMITNEDQNVGRLMAYLTDNALLENTIVIRMNDNGPNGSRFVGEMRGNKTHVHDGGIRSPFWLHWPAKVAAGTTVDGLTAHIDVMPTLLEACSAEGGPHPMDGISFLPNLTDPDKAKPLPERSITIQSHRGPEVKRYHHFMHRSGDWKLVHDSGFGSLDFEGDPEFKLYNIASDPTESKDVAAENPEVLARLIAEYDAWYDDVSTSRPNNYAPPRIIVGTKHEPVTPLTRQDWLGESWMPGSKGHWIVSVPKPVTADVEVIFDPEQITESSTVTLKLGITTLTKGAVGHTTTFSDIPLPTGEVRIEATQEKDGISAYQIILHTDAR